MNITQKYLYHASKLPNLKVLRPNKSTHNKDWLYATENKDLAVLFLGKVYDFICQIGTENGKPEIAERFENALEYAYEGENGSIYKLSSETFQANKTQWNAEFVSEKEVKVISEIRIKNVLDYINKLASEEQIIVYRFPNLPKAIPKDKSDLVEKAVYWTVSNSEDVLDELNKFHPDILDIVIQYLKAVGFAPKSLKWRRYFS